MLMQIFDELGVSPAESLMVGDTEFDLDMAARAGARSVGVSYGVHSRERLLRHGPERILSSITELRA
jgi:phosphoglycolate phosphatase